jgi:hypothetical protein
MNKASCACRIKASIIEGTTHPFFLHFLIPSSVGQPGRSRFCIFNWDGMNYQELTTERNKEIELCTYQIIMRLVVQQVNNKSVIPRLKIEQ